MQISQQTLATVQTLQANGQYAAAYSAIIQDLNSQGITLQTPGLSAADHDSLQWVTIAQQVNSGAQTEQALEIRAVNKAAVQYELGQSIDLFGPQEQASSNAVANAYLTQVITGNGTIPPLNVSINSDVTAGLGALGVSNAAHAAALPDGLSQIFTGFNNDTYYDGLSTAGQQEANFLHITASAMAAQYNLALSLGYSPTEANAVATSVANDFVAQQKSQNPILLSEESLMNGVGGATQTAASTWSSVQAFAAGVSQTLFGSGNSSSPAGTELTSFDGSGTVLADNQILHFSGGYTPNFAVGTNGGVTVGLTPSSGTGPTPTFDLSTSGTQAYVNGGSFFIGLPNGLTSLDAFGNLTFSSAAATLTVPTSGDVTLNIPGANGTTSTLNLGVLPTGAALSAVGSQVTITLPTGQTVQTLQVINLHTDGSYEQIVHNTDNVTTNEFDGSGQLVETINANVNGNVAITVFSTDSNSSWYSQSTAKDTNGNVIGTTLVERDGTQQMTFIDPSSGDSTTILQDAQGHWVNVSLGNTFNNYAQGIGDALASQIISGILIKHDLSASAAATAFTDAVIAHEAPLPGQIVDFRSEFATSLFSVAGGIGGSEVGGDLAELLGLPYQVGSIAGGTAGGLVGAYLGQQAAIALDIPVSQADVLTTLNFETGLAGAAGAYIGSQLANLVMPSNEGGEVTGAVATTAATLAVLTFEFSQPELLILTTFLSAIGADFVGTLIGDVIGDLFGDGYRGRPYAEAHIGIQNGQFALLEASQDNNGDPQEAITLANDTAQIDNEILATIGGSATNSANWSVGYHGTDYHSELTSQLPNETDYGDPTSAVNAAVIGSLRSTNITGGNLYMEYVLATANDTSLTQLDYDLNAARDYSLYVADPVSFDIALALGTQAQYDAWQAEYARVLQLGLTNLSFTGSNVTSGLIATSSGTPIFSLGLADAGNNVSLSGALINFAEGSATNGTVAGNDNTVLYGTGLTGMVVDGNNNNVGFNGDPDGDSGIGVKINGNGNTVNLSNAAQINISGGSNDWVYGSNDAVMLGTGVAGGTIVGNSNTIAFNGDSGGGGDIVVGVAGNHDTVNLSNAVIGLPEGYGGDDTINGSNDVVQLGTGLTGMNVIGNNNTIAFNGDPDGDNGIVVGVAGNHDTVDLSNAVIGLPEGYGGNDTVNGSNDVVQLGTGLTGMVVNGDNNIIAFNGDPDGDSGIGVTLSGNNDTVDLSNANIRLSANATNIAIRGNNDDIVLSTDGLRAALLTVSGTGDTITANSSVDVITLNTTGASVTLNGNNETLFAGDSNGTITLNGNAAGALLSGNSETMYINGVSSGATITGAYDGVVATGNYATVYENGTSGYVALDGDYFGVAVGGSGDTIYAHGNGGSVTVTGNSNGIALNGSGDTVYLNGNFETLVINGTGNGVLVNGSSNAIYVNASGNNITFASGSHNNGVGGGGIVNVGSGQQTTINSAGITIDLAAQDNLTASNDQVYLTASNTTETITGTGDTIFSSSSLSGIGLTINGNGSLAILNSTYDNVTVNATDSSINIDGSYETTSALGAGDTITLNGVYDGLLANANGQTVYADGAAATVTLAGSNSSLFANANDTIYANGTNDTVTLNGNSSGLTVNGDNATIIANGSAEIIHLNGANDTLTSGTGGQTVYITGAGDTATLEGTNNGVSISGTNDVVDLGVTAASVSLNSGAMNDSLTAISATINVANGVSFNLSGANDTVVASNGTLYLNASTTNIAIQGNNEIVHIRSGDTYTITGTGDTVITDTVTTAHNGTTIASYSGVSSLVDVTGLAYDSSITATFAQNSGGYAAQILVSDHGSLVDTINLQSAQNLGGLTVRPDGSGGTLVVDPPLSSTTQDSVHQAFADAWPKLVGRAEVGASSSHDTAQQFDFSGLTPNSTIPDDQHNSLRDFSHQDAALIRDGPGQNVLPGAAVPGTDSHNYADMNFDFSSLPSHPVSFDMIDYHLESFSQAAVAIAGDLSSPHQSPELHLPLEPDHHDFLAHLAPFHGWHL